MGINNLTLLIATVLLILYYYEYDQEAIKFTVVCKLIVHHYTPYSNLPDTLKGCAWESNNSHRCQNPCLVSDRSWSVEYMLDQIGVLFYSWKQLLLLYQTWYNYIIILIAVSYGYWSMILIGLHWNIDHKSTTVILIQYTYRINGRYLYYWHWRYIILD